MTESQVELYRAALKEARASFDSATRRLGDIESEAVRRRKEISQLRRTITALAAQCSEDPWSDALGITESCAEVMDEAIWEMSTQDVVRALENRGFDLASQKNAAASVHAVLSRLAEKKKIEKITKEENKTTAWRGPNYDASAAEISDDDIPF
jgi:hypothetical protein